MALGRLDAAMLTGLAELAERYGDGTLRFTPWQSVLLPNIAAAQAAAVIDAIKMYNPELVLVALAGSHLVEQARAAGLKVVSEAFADRAYNSDGSLVSRRLDGAVLHDSAFVARRVVSMLKNGGVESIDGVFTPIQADTICLHGDTAGALEMSAAIKAELLNHHIEIRPFVLKHEEVSNV